jgi:hypothetical protein
MLTVKGYVIVFGGIFVFYSTFAGCYMGSIIMVSSTYFLLLKMSTIFIIKPRIKQDILFSVAHFFV